MDDSLSTPCAGQEDDEFGLSSSLPGEGGSRNSRLARKAESARQARLRHKQYVGDLQGQVDGLQARVRQLEAHCTDGDGAAHTAIRELKGALNPEQRAQLGTWLTAAQGENHVLVKYEIGAGLPPPRSSASSAPISIDGLGCSSYGSGHWRGGNGTSPMESDEDSAFGPISRSWDDIEGARSILNLNSPNGFHPRGVPSLPPPTFTLGTAGSSLVSSSGFTGGSLMNGHTGMSPAISGLAVAAGLRTGAPTASEAGQSFS